MPIARAPDLFKKACEIVAGRLPAGTEITSIDYPTYVRGSPHGSRYSVVVHTTAGQQVVTIDHFTAGDQFVEGLGP